MQGERLGECKDQLIRYSKAEMKADQLDMGQAGMQFRVEMQWDWLDMGQAETLCRNKMRLTKYGSY